jgi:FkbM family methyltransferase
MLNWDYEREVREMLFSLAKDGDTFFDIGANEGLYSISFAQRFPNSRVYALEPIDNTLELLRANITISGAENIYIFPYGLSDKSGYVDFYVPADSGATSMAQLDEERFGHSEVQHSLVLSLDASVECLEIAPDIIKCDVEGAELLVFKGGAKTLEQHRPIIQCEMLRKWAKRFDYHPNDIIDFLSQYGYHCFTLRDGKLVRFEKMTDDTVETNFYFIHPEREVW